MVRMLMPVFLAAVVVAAAPAAAPTAGPTPADVESYLLRAGFTPAEVSSLERGQVLARVDDGTGDAELIVVAAVKVRSRRDDTARYYGRLVSYVDGQVTLGFGTFGTPPALADVETLVLDRDEIEAIRSCRPGDCDLKLGGVAIETLRRTVNWNAPDAAEQVNAAVRRAAVDYVAAYRARGDDALVTYNDRSQPLSLRAQWLGLLKESPYFHEYYPALRDYFAQYPRATLAGARDVIYWVNENYGMKPVLSIVHGVIYQAPDGTDRTVVAQKQLYASHYYEGSLAVATIVGATEAGKPVSYLVYGNRSRGDMLRGGFGGLKRKVARDQARKAAEQTLATIKTQLEQAAGIR